MWQVQKEKRTRKYKQTNKPTKTKTMDHGKSSFNSTMNIGLKWSLPSFNKYLMSVYYVPNTGLKEENRLESAMAYTKVCKR